MSRTFFRVRIGNVSADLTPLHNPNIDPYLKLNFAGDYKKLTTSVCKKTTRPIWGDISDFFYNTTFAHRLNVKFLVIDCFDKERIGADKLLGSCKVDLRTLATGPKHHYLSLIGQDGRTQAGFISFEVEMSEELRDFTIAFNNLSLPSWTPARVNPSSTLYWDISFLPEMSDKAQTSITTDEAPAVSSPHPVWKQPPPLVLHTDMAVLSEERTRVVFTLRVRTPGSPEIEYGKAHWDILSAYRPDREEALLILPLHNESTKVAELRCDLSFSKRPQLAQLQGEAKVALHHDKGITFTGTLRQGWPLPADFKHAAETTAPPPAAVAAVAAMAAAAPAAVTLFAPAPAPVSERSQEVIAPAPRRKVPEDDLQPCPRGWSMSTDSNGLVFFRYRPTRKTSWQDPRFLPEGWEQRVSASGELFFVNHPRQCTTWSDPRGCPPGWTMSLEPDPSKPDVTKPIFFYQPREGDPVLVSYTDPRGLPPGLSQHVDGTSRRDYYKDHVNRTTAWDDPRARLSASQRRQHLVAERHAWEVEQVKKVAAALKAQEQERSAALEEKKRSLMAKWESRMSEIKRRRQEWLVGRRNEWSLQQAIIQSEADAQAKELEAKSDDLKLVHAASIRAFEQQKERERRELEHHHAMELLSLSSRLAPEYEAIELKKEKALRELQRRKEAEMDQNAREMKEAEEDLQKEFASAIDRLEHEAIVLQTSERDERKTGGPSSSTLAVPSLVDGSRSRSSSPARPPSHPPASLASYPLPHPQAYTSPSPGNYAFTQDGPTLYPHPFPPASPSSLSPSMPTVGRMG